MGPEIKIPLLAFGLLAMLASAFMSRYAVVYYRSPHAPRGFLRPRDWRPVWKMRSWFTEARGFRLYWIGAVLLSLGSLAMFIAFVFGA